VTVACAFFFVSFFFGALQRKNENARRPVAGPPENSGLPVRVGIGFVCNMFHSPGVQYFRSGTSPGFENIHPKKRPRG
jgi:hypothetical protein